MRDDLDDIAYLASDGVLDRLVIDEGFDEYEVTCMSDEELSVRVAKHMPAKRDDESPRFHDRLIRLTVKHVRDRAKVDDD